MSAPGEWCTCQPCEIIREHGWRAEPQKTFAAGLAIGFGSAMIGLVIVLFLAGRFG